MVRLIFLLVALTGPFPAPERPQFPTEIRALVETEELTVTEDTEIRLDGQPCRFQDVPVGATIILLDRGPGRTIRKIHLRTGK